MIWTAKVEQDVLQAVVQEIAEQFAEWIDAHGFEIKWKQNQGDPLGGPLVEPDWDYASLARDFVQGMLHNE